MAQRVLQGQVPAVGAPQTVPSLLALLSLTVGWAVLAENGFSCLDLGIQPPDASWGDILKNAQTYVWTQPLQAVYPGLAILITVLCFNVLGNGLHDLLDPTNHPPAGGTDGR